MKIIDRAELYDTERDVMCPNGGFRSIRMLLESDGMGYSITHTTIPAGDWQRWHYKNHLESCYCIAGMAFIKKEGSTDHYVLKPGMMYVLDENDAHMVRAVQKTQLICVFNPPLKGREVHQKDGSYDV